MALAPEAPNPAQSAAIKVPEAPFMRGAQAISPELAGSVLDRALARGGDFADLYFEYRRSASISMEDGRVRSVGGAIDMGVGIRVVEGQGVGYAYSESLEPDAMLEAAETASRIAASASRHEPVKVQLRQPTT